MEVKFDPIGYKHTIAEKILENHKESNLKFKVDVDYHGVNVKFHLEDKRLVETIVEGLPFEWFQTGAKNLDLDIYWYNAENWASDSNLFEEDANPDYRFGKINTQYYIVYQRDMVAIHIGKGKWVVCSNPVIYDAVVNFFRLVIPGYLLAKDKLVLHSNCVLGHDEKAHVFLGESGAGKSTTASMAENRLVIGDDISIYSLDERGIFVQSSLLGGNPNLKAAFDQSYLVKDFYWLYQDNHTWFTPMNLTTFARRMMMSVILWTGNPDLITPQNKVFSLVTKFANKSEFHNLGFCKNNNDFYQSIETGFTYDRIESRT